MKGGSRRLYVLHPNINLIHNLYIIYIFLYMHFHAQGLGQSNWNEVNCSCKSIKNKYLYDLKRNIIRILDHAQKTVTVSHKSSSQEEEQVVFI